MLPSDKMHILEESISDLQFSSDFKKVMDQLRFKTLKDVIGIRVPELLKMPGFDLHILVEMTNFLEDHKLAHLLIH